MMKYDCDQVGCCSGFFMLAMNFDDNNYDLAKNFFLMIMMLGMTFDDDADDYDADKKYQ